MQKNSIFVIVYISIEYLQICATAQVVLYPTVCPVVLTVENNTYILYTQNRASLSQHFAVMGGDGGECNWVIQGCSSFSTGPMVTLSKLVGTTACVRDTLKMSVREDPG